MPFAALWGALLTVGVVVLLPIVRPQLRKACGRAARWGLHLSVPAFVVGYVGPVLVNWGGNLGPLLGVFVTGPAGFVIGAVLGLLYELCRRPDRTR
jgi:hypothetical protein